MWFIITIQGAAIHKKCRLAYASENIAEVPDKDVQNPPRWPAGPRPPATAPPMWKQEPKQPPKKPYIPALQLTDDVAGPKARPCPSSVAGKRGTSPFVAAPKPPPPAKAPPPRYPPGERGRDHDPKPLTHVLIKIPIDNEPDRGAWKSYAPMGDKKDDGRHDDSDDDHVPEGVGSGWNEPPEAWNGRWIEPAEWDKWSFQQWAKRNFGQIYLDHAPEEEGGKGTESTPQMSQQEESDVEVVEHADDAGQAEGEGSTGPTGNVLMPNLASNVHGD